MVELLNKQSDIEIYHEKGVYDILLLLYFLSYNIYFDSLKFILLRFTQEPIIYYFFF